MNNHDTSQPALTALPLARCPAHADRALFAELHWLAASRTPASAVTVARFEDPLGVVGEHVRGHLQHLDSKLLCGDGELWLARRAGRQPDRSSRAAH